MQTPPVSREDTPNASQIGSEAAMLLHDSGSSAPTFSIPTTDLFTGSTPSRVDPDEQEHLLMYGKDIPSRPYGLTDETRNNPQGTPQQNTVQHPKGDSNKQGLIFHICYEKGHAAPTCTLPVREQYKMVRNYESLFDKEKERVPSSSYEAAKAMRTAARDGALCAEEGDTPTVSQPDSKK